MNDTLPAVEVLAGVDRDQLWELIEQHAASAWAGAYEYRWQRDDRTLVSMSEVVYGDVRSPLRRSFEG